MRRAVTDDGAVREDQKEPRVQESPRVLPLNPNERTAEESVVLTVQQAAALLQVSENHLYSLIGQKAVPHIRLGKLIRIPRWGLLQYIAASSGAPFVDGDGVAFAEPQSVHVHQPAKEGD